MTAEMMPYAITLALILLDFATGLVKAFASGAYKSSKMRQGLYNKVAFLLIMLLGVIVDIGQAYLNLPTTLPIGTGLCGLISFIEISSVVENACAINPELSTGVIKAIFGLSEHDKNDKET